MEVLEHLEGGAEEEEVHEGIPGLRLEIIASQKARTDLLKWKMVLTAALGTVGLGLYKPEGPTEEVSWAPFTLCCIPLACIYVDLLCAHLSLRIKVIGTYFRKKAEVTAIPDRQLISYEQFVQNARTCG